MLYFGDGARRIEIGDETLYLYRDYSDPRQYYLLPNFPHVAKTPDGTPAISLLVFRENLDEVDEDDEEAVAFLSLDVDLSWERDTVDKAANKIQLEDSLTEPPRITPILYRDGTARLMLLDAATPTEESGDGVDDAAPTEFVAKILGAGQPSLYGDNRAIFQARLTKKGAIALSGAMEGVTPIGVVYALTFAGLQPAFNITATADWDKVYDHLSTQHSVNALFVSADIEESLDKLEEDRFIEIDVTVEGIGAEAMDAQREEAMSMLKRMIFEQFFELSFQRVDAAGQSTTEELSDLFADTLQSSLTLGVGYSYRRKDVRIEELRSLELNWTARRATTRNIYPQAHMYTTLRKSGMLEDGQPSFVRVVGGGEDAIWNTVALQVMAAAPWETDGIAAIKVDIEYDDPDSGETQTWSTTLDPTKTSDEHRDWMDRASGSSFRYKYEVVFQGDDGVPGPAPKVNSGEFAEEAGTILVIHPRELYESHRLEVGVLPGFAFERWPTVQAAMRYRTEDGSFEHYADGLLSQTTPTFSTRYRIDKEVPGSRELRLSYFGESGKRIDLPWAPMETDNFVVEDPQPDSLTVRAIVAGKRANIANLIVDLEYVDEENAIREAGHMEFNPDNIGTPQTWTVTLADPTRRRYRYRMTLVDNEGNFIATGWIGSDAPTLPVGEVYVRRLQVEIVTGELAEGVERVEVALEYGEAGSEARVEQTYTLGSNARAEWMVQLPDASARSYQLTTTWVSPDGFNTTVGPETRSDTLLVIPGAPPEGIG